MIDLSALNLKVYDYPGLLKPGDMYFSLNRTYIIENETKIYIDRLDLHKVVINLKFVIDVTLDYKVNQFMITYVPVKEKEKSFRIAWFNLGRFDSKRLIVMPAISSRS